MHAFSAIQLLSHSSMASAISPRRLMETFFETAAEIPWRREAQGVGDIGYIGFRLLAEHFHCMLHLYGNHKVVWGLPGDSLDA